MGKKSIFSAASLIGRGSISLLLIEWRTFLVYRLTGEGERWEWGEGRRRWLRRIGLSMGYPQPQQVPISRKW